MTSPNADSGRDIDWSNFGPCRCGAPAGTPCLDLRMGPKASTSRPHKGRPPAPFNGAEHNHGNHELRPEGACPRCDAHHRRVRARALEIAQERGLLPPIGSSGS